MKISPHPKIEPGLTLMSGGDLGLISSVIKNPDAYIYAT
jgi:hypothetical protein